MTLMTKIRQCKGCGADVNGSSVPTLGCEMCAARIRRQRYCARHPEADRKSKMLWAQRNAEQVKEAKTMWRLANKDQWNKTGKAWKKANPGAMKKYRLRKYGLTLEQYEALVKKQDGRCAICDTATPAKHGSWCIDHDHETNKMRGLLCLKCNAGLGSFDDSPANLLAAERYLQLHRSPASAFRDSPCGPQGAGDHFLKAV